MQNILGTLAPGRWQNCDTSNSELDLEEKDSVFAMSLMPAFFEGVNTFNYTYKLTIQSLFNRNILK